ncbi:hypothetical protein TRFO_06480 [Tritrichomonas foetus]|uniref:Spt20-like SEP domain-containing protein n=1 Tax=Tritrichomonas foetus TaxID=1144522 RepID=A0A1J4JYB8_9EUKA|nr:hypothetical protein TRFO_06480 [Tritrichomonas foetus]|eukprot:OHT04153.1 hypothetical protein TRFO_06480 [Tritrichomonas foetus]
MNFFKASSHQNEWETFIIRQFSNEFVSLTCQMVKFESEIDLVSLFPIYLFEQFDFSPSYFFSMQNGRTLHFYKPRKKNDVAVQTEFRNHREKRKIFPPNIYQLLHQETENSILLQSFHPLNSIDDSIISDHRAKLGYILSKLHDDRFNSLTPPDELFEKVVPSIYIELHDCYFLIINIENNISPEIPYDQTTVSLLEPLATGIITESLMTVVDNLLDIKFEAGCCVCDVTDFRITPPFHKRMKLKIGNEIVRKVFLPLNSPSNSPSFNFLAPTNSRNSISRNSSGSNTLSSSSRSSNQRNINNNSENAGNIHFSNLNVYALNNLNTTFLNGLHYEGIKVQRSRLESESAVVLMMHPEICIDPSPDVARVNSICDFRAKMWREDLTSPALSSASSISSRSFIQNSAETVNRPPAISLRMHPIKQKIQFPEPLLNIFPRQVAKAPTPENR